MPLPYACVVGDGFSSHRRTTDGRPYRTLSDFALRSHLSQRERQVDFA